VTSRTKTTDETRAAARLLLSQQTTDAEHVAADLAEANGDMAQAHDLRGGSTTWGRGSRTRLTISAEHIPPTMRKTEPWMLLGAAYSDEVEASVIGNLCFGVDVTAIGREVLGTPHVDWLDILRAPRRTQQALAMLVIAEIRDARATSRVVSGVRKMHRGARIMKTAYIQPEINGQTFALDANGKRIDTLGGPADFLIRFYLLSGCRVIDSAGHEAAEPSALGHRLHDLRGGWIMWVCASSGRRLRERRPSARVRAGCRGE
jgi:hypothetical protein